MSSLRRTGLAVGVIVAAAVTGAILVAGPAGAQIRFERILSYDVEIRIEDSGAILVRETIEYDFGDISKHGIFRDIPVRVRFDDRYDRVYPLQVLSVQGSRGTPDQYVLEDLDGVTRIKIGDPDETITGPHTYTIEYRVLGTLNGFPDHDELFWNAIGPDWAIDIEHATARVSGPAPFTQIACSAGAYGSTLPCTGARAEGDSAVFEQESLFPYQGLTVVVGLPKGAVSEPRPILEERWSLRRAFSLTPFTVVASSLLMLAAVAGFAWLVWRRGRDRRAIGSAIDVLWGTSTGGEQTVPLFEKGEGPVEFAPPEDLHAGQVGTLIDETANPLDVSATIVDLAVRGFLSIKEIPKEGWFGKPDWKLTKLREAEGLLEYERRLLDGLFEDGPELALSHLKAKFADRLRRVQEALYEEVTSRGWFAGRPDRVRRRWALIGLLAFVAAIALLIAAVLWTKVALLAVPIVIGSVLLLIGARFMPARTPRGTGLLRRVVGFRRVIETADTHFARWAEQENVFYRYLPFAIVFGLTDKWAKAFASLAQPPQQASWYVSSNPFSLVAFSAAMDGFTVTTSGTLTATPAGSGSSGLGGGGFSGGGGGGGGGGSW